MNVSALIGAVRGYDHVHKMSGVAVLYSVVFLLYSIMEVLGLMPQEVRSAGITLSALFSRYYGDQVGCTALLNSAHV